MDKVGLDMLLDIHGDEELPYNFINGNEVGNMDCVTPHRTFAFHPQLALHLLSACMPSNALHILEALCAHEL